MRRNVLFDKWMDDLILCDGNYGLGEYGMDLVHNLETGLPSSLVYYVH